MNKLFTKIAALSVGLAMAIGVGVAVGSQKSATRVKAVDSEEFTPASSGGWITTQGAQSGTKGIVTIATDNGAYNASSGGSLRVYSGATFTVSVSGGNATSIVYTTSQGDFTEADVGTLSNKSWSGSASEVNFSNAAQVRLTKVTIEYVASGPVETYTISYNSNGGSGTMESTTGANPAVAACTFTAPEGKIFSEWNDASDGSGDSYAVGAKPGANLNLYAIWVDKPECVTLEDIGVTLGSDYNTTMDTVDIIDGSDTYTLNYLQGKKQGNAMILCKDANAFVSNHTEIPYSITSVELFINSGASGKTTYDVAFGTSEFTTATAGIGAVNIAGGESHVFENASVSDAKYFCVTLGNSNNGQVLKIVVNYEKGVDPSKKNMVIYTSGNPADGSTIMYSKNAGTHVFSAKEEETTVSGVTWSVSDTTVATINASTGAMTTVKPGNVVVYAQAEGYNKASASLTISKGWIEELVVTGSMSKTSYTVGEEWSHAGLVAIATFHSGWEEDVASDSATTWTYNPASPALGVTSVVATATYDEESASSAAQVVTVSRTNPIQQLYTKAKGADSGEFYGYYVGFATGSGPILMDGEYGIMLFNNSQDVSGWTEGETIIHVTAGTIDVYNGLYEVKSYTLETVSSADVLAPIVHTTTGSETATEANRQSNAAGKVAAAPTKGNFTDPAGTSDIQFTYTVGSNTFTVFYKKAAQTDEVIATLADSLANSTQITLKGFTSWYNNFQFTMVGLVEASGSYTAEDFSQDLLDLTDGVCAGWHEGVNNHDALVTVWSTLQGTDKYYALSSDEMEVLAEAERDESGTVVERAMARYDFLVGKYDLSNFITGRTPIASQRGYLELNAESNNSTMIIIVVIASVSAISLATLLILKKKKHN